MVPVRREWEAWKEAYAARQTICCYEKGPGRLFILDNRPKPGESTTTLRRIALHGIAAAIYLFCDEARSARAIREMIKRDYLGAWTESRIRDWLTQLTGRGLMWNEDDRYVALATRRSN